MVCRACGAADHLLLKGADKLTIYQISVFVENRLGRLSEITGVLAKENIDIRALSIADTSDFGILRLIVNQPDRAVEALRAAGITVSKTEVVAVRLNDRPGGLHEALVKLGENSITVEYVYAFITKSDDAYVILRVEDNQKAAEVLRSNGYQTLCDSDVYGI